MSDLTPPPEPAGGQETEPPDLRLALNATIRLLDDIGHTRQLDDDLTLRVFAVRAVLHRLRHHLENNPKGRGRLRRWWLTLGAKP